MIRRRVDMESQCCPFIDHNDTRCSQRFTLGRVEQAMRLCMQDYRSCSTYHQLSGGFAPPIQITVAGRRFASAKVA